MTELQLSNTKRIGFLGFGISNRSVYDFLKDLGSFEFTVRDRLPQRIPFIPARTYYGNDILKNIDEDVLFISPSFKRNLPELDEAIKRGTILSSDAELFFAIYGKEAYGITGTSGKSTVTHLISEMLTVSGTTAYPIGNFGTGFLSYSKNAFTVVAELSSFQLMYLEPKLTCAVITNIGEDHLNWHSDVTEYRQAKLKILKNADKAVIDADCRVTVDAISSRKVSAAVSAQVPYKLLKEKIDAENYLTLSDDSILLNGELFFDISRAIRREDYNLKNYMLSAAAVLDRANPRAMSEVANSFKGLPHRCEQVSFANGISYINSSIDTSPERALSTILAVSGAKVPIFCGTGKSLSYKRLAEETVRSCEGAVLMGEVGDIMEKELKSVCASFKAKKALGMKEAVRSAENILSGEGSVILAPAGVSYDKYKSFEQRGNDFRLSITKKLK